jgi:hypothetical protein
MKRANSLGSINYSIMALIQLELGAEQPDLDVEKATELYDSKIKLTKQLMEDKIMIMVKLGAMRVSSLTDLFYKKIASCQTN